MRSNTAALENQNINFASLSVENRKTLEHLWNS
jgi:hypothetical protein